MPQRANVRTFDTSDVQGDGSWIKLRPMTLGEIIALQQQAQDREGILYRVGRWLGRVFRRRPSRLQVMQDNMRGVFEFVRSWNWVDDDGEPFPQPPDDPSVLYRLTRPEMQCITDCVNGARQSEEQKN